ncbi:MAG: hypothetical protein OQK93_01085 [Gammaproteobacteria bacterium]|jgi:hypothetical protein|nr:hypothetical protein [Gammaproteobacteria bacterium]
MNSNYNYSDFSGIHLTANNETQRYDQQRELKQVSKQSYESQEEKRIEAMLLSHSKYHIYCE